MTLGDLLIPLSASQGTLLCLSTFKMEFSGYTDLTLPRALDGFHLPLVVILLNPRVEPGRPWEDKMTILKITALLLSTCQMSTTVPDTLQKLPFTSSTTLRDRYC